MKPKAPATNGARKLRAKLAELAARPGTIEEGIAATVKLKRLLARYDFSQVDVRKEYLFAGHFRSSGRDQLQRIAELPDPTLGHWVKWAVEESTRIPCTFRGIVLHADATPDTADKLRAICQTISQGFTQLWTRFASFPTINPEDKALFLRGLWDGMMQQAKPAGEALPLRAVPKMKKAKRSALGKVSGLQLHPYAVAIELGEQIRFSAPLVEVENRLESLRPEQLAA